MGSAIRAVIGKNDGERITNPIGGTMIVKLHDRDTHDAYSIHDNVLPAGSPGPRPHRHLNHDEVFYVIDGELTVRIGAETHTAQTGSFVIVPRGVVHQPSNPSEKPVHVLLIFSPGGMDDFFVEVAAKGLPLQKEPDDIAVQRALAEFTQSYGYEFADF